MMDVRAYRLWLLHALGCGSTKVRRILKYAGSIEEFYKGGERAWVSMGIFTERELCAMREFSADDALFQIEYCERLGQKIYTPEHPEYPGPLRQIANPPGVLFVKGTLPDFDRMLSIAVVGSRKATKTGIDTARRLGFDLAKAGAVVVSGGAIGVDIAAHEGALEAGGVTVCLLACGINYPYLTQNASIRERIAKSGALVSEYPPDTGIERGNFEVRNRLISGLSRGVAVVEAKEKSGSMITVRYALDQGRDVFSVPGDLGNANAAGTNALIQNGAKLITCAEDILEEYAFGRFEKAQAAAAEKAEAENAPGTVSAHETASAPGTASSQEDCSQDAAAILRLIGREPIHLSALSAASGFSAARTLSALTELELSGKIVSCSGRRYILSDTVMI